MIKKKKGDKKKKKFFLKKNHLTYFDFMDYYMSIFILKFLRFFFFSFFLFRNGMESGYDCQVLGPGAKGEAKFLPSSRHPWETAPKVLNVMQTKKKKKEKMKKKKRRELFTFTSILKPFLLCSFCFLSLITYPM